MSDPTPQDPGRPAREFSAAAAQAARPSDDWIRALATGQPQGGPALPPAQLDTGAPAEAPIAGPSVSIPAATQPIKTDATAIPTMTVTAPNPNQPLGLAIDDASRQPGVGGFFRGLLDAAHAGAAQSLRDLQASGEAVAGRAPAPEQQQPGFAQPLAWGDLLHPETALDKAVYQVAHGAPVLAGGALGAMAGGALTAETGPGAAIGSLAGGALGAGAVSSAQSLGPYFAAALRAPGATSDTAFATALKQAGQDGAFTAAGWALFGFKPFAGAVKNLLLQAFGVQPAAAVAEKAVQNVEAGQPVTQDLGAGVPSAVVQTVLPALAHAGAGRALEAAGMTPGSGGAAAPAEAATAAAEGGVTPGAAAAKASGLETLNPASIKVDAQRFQFKSGGDEAGVTDRLQGVKTWDPRLAGTVMVWRDDAGQDWIADGHQRLGLAQRMVSQGQDVPGINAFVLNSADGISAEQARTIAAAKNIAEGTGTSIDAAKVIRDAAQNGTPLPELPPRSALVRDGTALAKLSPQAFGMAVNEVVPPNQAAIVGRLVSDGPQQVEALRVLSTLKPENLRQTESVVRDMLATGTEPGVQHSLFGAEDFASSIVLERAKIIDEATRQLGRDRRTFGVLVNRSDEIASAGNQLAGEANQQRLSTDEQASQLLQTLATTRGPVSDELSAIARDFKSGTISRADAGRRFLRTIRRAIEEGLDTGPASGGAGPGDAAGTGGGAGAGEAGAGEQLGVKPPPAAGDLIGNGDLWRLSPEQLEAMLAEQQLSDHDKIVQALGSEEAAREYQRLDRARNDVWNTKRADQAQADLERRFGQLTPEQERLIYGHVGEPSADDIRQVLEAHGARFPDHPETAAYEAAAAIRKVRPEELAAVPQGSASGAAQAAYVRLMNAIEDLKAAGVSGADLPNQIAKSLVTVGGWKPEDAAEIVRDFMQRAQPQQSAAASKPAAIAAPQPTEPPAGTAATDHPVGYDGLFGPESDLGKPHTPPPGLSIDGDALDRLEATPELQERARRFLNGETDQNPVQASLESLTRSPDIDAEVKRLATFVPRDGVKSDDVLRTAAYTLQMDVTEAAAALRGRLPTDQQVGAFAMMMNSAAREAYDAAQTAVQSGAQEDWTKAIRATVLMQRLLGEWTQAGTEQGRAFRARQLAWDARADITQQVQDVINFVGQANVEELVRKIGALDDPAKVPPFMRTLRWMGGRDGLLYGWYNMLLSNPTTFVKKGISDGTMAAFNLAARYAAEKSSDSVAPGEGGELLAGYIGATGDALRAAWKAMQAGHSQFASEHTMLDGLSTNSRLSLLAAGMEPAPDEGPTLRGWQYLRAFLPTSLIGGMDDFAKVMNYRAELRAGAWRKAWQEGLTGDAQIARQTELLDVVPPDLHEQAMEGALRNTFQEPLQGLSQHMKDFADWTVRLHGTGLELPLGRMLLPFVRTPANIIRTAANWTPLPLAFEGTQVRADLAAGGARRALRLAQTGLGSGIAMIGAGLAWSGQMTGAGPSQPDLRRAWLNAGYQPYSIRIGDNWYGYRKIEPVGVLWGAIADTADLVRYANQEDALHAVTSLVFGVGNAILSASYLEGISGFIDALNNPSTEAPRYLVGQTTSMFIPQGVSAVERATDEWRRAHYAFLDTIRSKIPGAAEGLPAARDSWGDPIPQRDAFLPGLTGTGAARLLSPVSFAPADNADPIKKWIWEHRASFPNFDNGKLGFYSFAPVQSFTSPDGSASAQVPLTAAQLDRLKELAGNGLKDPRSGLGLKDYLNRLVQGTSPDKATQSMWDRSTDEARAVIVHRAFDRARAAAKQVLLQQNPDLQEQVMAQWQARRAKLAPPGSAASAPAGTAPPSTQRMPVLEGTR